ncbi:parvalbumin 6 [Scomber scombrus]|uniref:Parvalbumin n=1 Tax=Scomber scombrus TaxID=13677 RepID=A0AAV1NZ28_SCOSC
MAMTSILNADDIKKALDAFAGKNFPHINNIVAWHEELIAAKCTNTWLQIFVLKGFAKDGRDLTDKETKAFLQAADKDGDGKIGVDEFAALVKE